MERFLKDCLGKHFKCDLSEGDLFYPYPGRPGLKPVSYLNPLENVGYKITCPIVFDRIQHFIRKRYKVRFVLSLLVLILWLGVGSIGGLMTTRTGLLIIGISTVCFCGFRIWYFFKIKSLILKGIGFSKKSTFKERWTKLPYLYFSFLSRITISAVVFMYYVSPNISDDKKMEAFFMLSALYYFFSRYYMLYWGLKSDQSYEKLGKL